MAHSKCNDPFCKFCGPSLDVSLPQHLLDELIANRLVIFAGGGVSTESRYVFPTSFYDKVRISLDLDYNCDFPFPDLMSKFCETFGRTALLGLIKERLDYWHRFPEVYVRASAFHREISTTPFLNEIFTTNWDDLFESVCHATPFVTPEDLALWNFKGRRVFKIHGSINNLGSIVATRDDYESCYKRLSTGVMGSQLKLTLATKTVLFIGYSLRDDDFLRIWRLVHDEIGSIAPKAYWINPCETAPNEIPIGLTQIQTTAVQFAIALKNVLVDMGVMLHDSVWRDVMNFRDRVVVEHRRLTEGFPLERYPDAMYSQFYQDGLVHACDWLFAQATGGQAAHACYIRSHIEAYEELINERRRDKNYGDVAYLEGFANGLFYPLAKASDKRRFPLYYLFGLGDDICSLSSFRKHVRSAAMLHKSAHKFSQQAVKEIAGSSEPLVLHHSPFL